MAGIGFTAAPRRAAADAHRRFVCIEAHCLPYIYDPNVGNPAANVPAGTTFADLPDDWVCPICGAGKHRFIPLG